MEEEAATGCLGAEEAVEVAAGGCACSGSVDDSSAGCCILSMARERRREGERGEVGRGREKERERERERRVGRWRERMSIHHLTPLSKRERSGVG